MNRNTYILTSGLTVHFITNNHSRQKMVAASINCGSKNVDVPFTGNTPPYGLSHFLEHMLFYKSSGYIGNNFLDIGEYCNAMTTYAGTVVYSSANIDLDKVILLILKTVFQQPIFTTNNVEKERTIISEEIRKENSYYAHHLQNILASKIYEGEKTTAKLPIVGTLNTIINIQPKQLISLYERYYLPENTSFYLVGNIENQIHIISLIEDITKELMSNRNLNISSSDSVDLKKFGYGLLTVDKEHSNLLNKALIIKEHFTADQNNPITRMIGFFTLEKIISYQLKNTYELWADINIDYSYIAMQPISATIDNNFTSFRNLIDNVDHKIVDRIRDELELKADIIDDHINLLGNTIIDLDLQGIDFQTYREYISNASTDDIYKCMLNYLSNTQTILLN